MQNEINQDETIRMLQKFYEEKKTPWGGRIGRDEAEQREGDERNASLPNHMLDRETRSSEETLGVRVKVGYTSFRLSRSGSTVCKQVTVRTDDSVNS